MHILIFSQTMRYGFVTVAVEVRVRTVPVRGGRVQPYRPVPVQARRVQSDGMLGEIKQECQALGADIEKEQKPFIPQFANGMLCGRSKIELSTNLDQLLEEVKNRPVLACILQR